MERTVTVTGHGSATAVPDTAVVRVAAAQRAASVADAFAGVTAAVALIGRTAREHAEERKIASRDLSLWPAHDNQGRPSGFEARHAVEIGCPSIEAAGALLEALVAAVGDRLQVESVQLQVSDPARLVTEAREAAYADAVARATHLATLAGATLGQVIAVSEGGAGGPVPMMEARSFKADADFLPGESSTGAAVTVTFALG